MSLKEWKDNELNMLLMKKWGLLSEKKMPRGDAGHGGSEDEHYQFDKKEREAELEEGDRENLDELGPMAALGIGAAAGGMMGGNKRREDEEEEDISNGPYSPPF